MASDGPLGCLRSWRVGCRNYPRRRLAPLARDRGGVGHSASILEVPLSPIPSRAYQRAGYKTGYPVGFEGFEGGERGAAGLDPTSPSDCTVVHPVSCPIGCVIIFNSTDPEKVPVVVFFWMTRRTHGCRVCRQPAVISGFKLAAWTKRKPLSDAGAKGLSCKVARPVATTAPLPQH
jgi:hypothetical protein